MAETIETLLKRITYIEGTINKILTVLNVKLTDEQIKGADLLLSEDLNKLTNRVTILEQNVQNLQSSIDI